MKSIWRARVFLLLPALLLASCIAMAQEPNAEIQQQDALELLKTLARDLKREPDKLAAGRLQARIADELWAFDEAFARETFRWAFEAVSQPAAADLANDKHAAYISRQASS